MRLQVFISHSGLCSRRKALDLVFEGRVSVNNNEIREPSYQVDPDKDVVCVDARKLSVEKKEYIMLNKPKAIVTTRKDRFAPKTVFECIPKNLNHLYPVGRLDKESQGLLIFTNDGELAFRLMHPRFGVKKEYLVTLNNSLKETDKHCLEKGVLLDDKLTNPAKIFNLSHNKGENVYKVVIHEGRKRQIRRMFLGLGYRVVSLKRVAYGALKLGSLAEGKWRHLDKEELNKLFDCVSLGKSF